MHVHEAISHPVKPSSRLSLCNLDMLKEDMRCDFPYHNPYCHGSSEAHYWMAFDFTASNSACSGWMAEPLSEQLDAPHSPDQADLKIALGYLHLATADESDFLFGKPQGRQRSRKKRKLTTAPVGKNGLQFLPCSGIEGSAGVLQ